MYAPPLSWNLEGGEEPPGGGLQFWIIGPPFLLGLGVLVTLCWPGWQLAHEEGLRGAGLLLVYVRGHVESSFGLAPPFVVFAALP